MNCPNCGAENEAGARFCVECGAPLETQANLPDRPPEVEAMDNDRTMVSSFGRLAEEAKTVSVTQEEMAEAEAASAFARGPEPEVIPPFSEPVAGSGGGSGGQGGIPSGGGSGPGRGWMNQRNIIIAVIILLVLCCCCSIIGGSIAASSGTFDPYLSAILPDYSLI